MVTALCGWWTSVRTGSLLFGGGGSPQKQMYSSSCSLIKPQPAKSGYWESLLCTCMINCNSPVLFSRIYRIIQINVRTNQRKKLEYIICMSTSIQIDTCYYTVKCVINESWGAKHCPSSSLPPSFVSSFKYIWNWNIYLSFSFLDVYLQHTIFLLSPCLDC